MLLLEVKHCYKHLRKKALQSYLYYFTYEDVVTDVSGPGAAASGPGDAPTAGATAGAAAAGADETASTSVANTSMQKPGPSKRKGKPETKSDSSPKNSTKIDVPVKPHLQKKHAKSNSKQTIDLPNTPTDKACEKRKPEKQKCTAGTHYLINLLFIFVSLRKKLLFQ